MTSFTISNLFKISSSLSSLSSSTSSLLSENKSSSSSSSSNSNSSSTLSLSNLASSASSLSSLHLHSFGLSPCEPDSTVTASASLSSERFDRTHVSADSRSTSVEPITTSSLPSRELSSVLESETKGTKRRNSSKSKERPSNLTGERKPRDKSKRVAHESNPNSIKLDKDKGSANISERHSRTRYEQPKVERPLGKDFSKNIQRERISHKRLDQGEKFAKDSPTNTNFENIQSQKFEAQLKVRSDPSSPSSSQNILKYDDSFPNNSIASTPTSVNPSPLERNQSFTSSISSPSSHYHKSTERTFSSATTCSGATYQDISSSSSSVASALQTTRSSIVEAESSIELELDQTLSTPSPNPTRPHISFFSSSPDGQFNTIRLNRSLDSAAPTSKTSDINRIQINTKPQELGAQVESNIPQHSDSPSPVSFPLRRSIQKYPVYKEKTFERVAESDLYLNPSLLPLTSGHSSFLGKRSATLDSNLPQNPSLSNPDHNQSLNLSPTSTSSSSSLRPPPDRQQQLQLAENAPSTTNPCIFTLDKPLNPEQAPHPNPQTNLTRNLSLNTPSPPPVASLISQQSNLVQSPPQILSPQSSAPLPTTTPGVISRFHPKTQSLTAVKLVPSQKQAPIPPFSIATPTDQNTSSHHHRRSYSISQPVSRLAQDPISQPSAPQKIIEPITQPIQRSAIQSHPQSSLKVDSGLPESELGVKSAGNTKIFKSYSTRESKSARQRREEEENRFSKSFSTREHKGGSPRLLPPVVIKTRTSSVRSHSRASYIRSRNPSPPTSVLDREYVSPFSPTFQRRNSHVLHAPTEPIDQDQSAGKHSTFSPSRSIRSSRSFRSTRSHTVVSRGPSSSSRSPSRSASVRFLRKSFKKITNPLSNQSLISSSPDTNKSHPALDSTTIRITDHDLPANNLDNKPTSENTEQTDKDSTTKQTKDRLSSSEASSPSDLQKSRKLRTFQSQDNQDSDQLSETSSHR